MTFLDKSFCDRAKVKDPAIFPLAAKVLDIIDENNEVDVPNPIPPNFVSDDKSMNDDDDTCQGDEFDFPLPSIL